MNNFEYMLIEKVIQYALSQTYSKGHGMGNTKFGNISGPERFEMISQTDLPSSVHFGSFSI